MQTSFILSCILSEGQFETDINLILHENIRECFRCCKLIGPNKDEDSLIGYSNELFWNYIIEQVQYFPNTQRVIDFWVITANELFQRIIVYNELKMSNIPPVQLSSLIASQEEEIL